MRAALRSVELCLVVAATEHLAIDSRTFSSRALACSMKFNPPLPDAFVLILYYLLSSCNWLLFYLV